MTSTLESVMGEMDAFSADIRKASKDQAKQLEPLINAWKAAVLSALQSPAVVNPSVTKSAHNKMKTLMEHMSQMKLQTSEIQNHYNILVGGQSCRIYFRDLANKREWKKGLPGKQIIEKSHDRARDALTESLNKIAHSYYFCWKLLRRPAGTNQENDPDTLPEQEMCDVQTDEFKWGDVIEVLSKSDPAETEILFHRKS